MKKQYYIFGLVIIFVILVGGFFVKETKEDREDVLNEEIKTGDSFESIIVDDHERTYLLHVPPKYSSTKKYPLLLVFHGGGGNSEKIAKQTGFSDYADRERFIVVYPDSIEKNWNDGRGTTDAEKLGVDDVKFVRSLVEQLKEKFSIDEKRIYATGVSNGGIFSHLLGCEMVDVFAAIGPVIGSIATNIVSACNPIDPISVVVIQGTEDPFIPIEGGDTKHKARDLGDGGLVESAQNTMELWASKNGCKMPPRVTTLPVLVEDGTHVEKTTYDQCRNNTKVTYHIVKGMGHIWPSGTASRLRGVVRSRISGPASRNIDATEVIWEFFAGKSKK